MESQYERSTNHHTTFTLRMFEEDVINIASLVSKVQHEETGGNLFGLWTNSGNAVVFVATGPGENCRRTAVSFYQDVPYMSRVGHLLTNQYPLCHIGEWHSHHQLQLYEPSGGDCSTIRRNYPSGSQGFLLMIANITPDIKVVLSPYKFLDGVRPFLTGNVETVSTTNPFNQVSLIMSTIKDGKETSFRQEASWFPSRRDRDERARTQSQQDEGYKYRRRSRSPMKDHSERQLKRSPNHNDQQHTSVVSQRSVHTPQPPEHPRQNSTDNNRLRRIRVTQPRTTEEDNPVTLIHGNVRVNNRYPPAGQSQENTVPVSRSPLQWYEDNPDILRDTLSFIKAFSDDNKVSIERDKATKELSLEFKHYFDHAWTMHFPNNFPKKGKVTLSKRYASISSDTKKISLSGDFTKFKHDFKTAFKRFCYCSKCWSNFNNL